MITNQQISQLSKGLFERLPDLLDKFDIQYSSNERMYTMACPVHGGDNLNACTIFIDGAPNWSCWTHSCQEEFKKTLFGFVRGVLSHRHGKSVSMDETARFCSKFLDQPLDSIEPVEENLTAKKQVRLIETFEKQPVREGFKIDRGLIINSLDIPSAYYLGRGFSKEILTEFDIGDCFKQGKLMNGRAVAPVYDEDWNYVGCTGRSIYDNNPRKWMNSPDLKKSQFLYGLNIAKSYIMKTMTVIIVEGQGDVWRAHEAGFKNTVSIMGASFSDEQLILLEKSGCFNLVILTDMDDAGHKVAKVIREKCGRRFNYVRPEIPAHDIGDLTIEQAKKFLESVCQKF